LTVAEKTADSVTLGVTGAADGADIEYSVDGGATWQASPTFTGLSADTEYNFVARYAGYGNYNASGTSAGLTVKTNAAHTNGDGLSGGEIAGIAVGSVSGIGLIAFAIFWFVIKKKKVKN
jgi:hypothetical protein